MSRIRDFASGRGVRRGPGDVGWTGRHVYTHAKQARGVRGGADTGDDAAVLDWELNASAMEADQTSSAAEPEPSANGTVEAEEDMAPDEAPAEARISHIRLALSTGLVVIAALAALTAWLGFRSYESHQSVEQRNLLLQVGRQGALNLTTIDWQEADTDVRRILESATGTFYDDFSKRSAPFIQVVKQAQSKSVGTVTEAGLESESDNGAQVLVAVSVKTSNAGAAEQEPRAWRMRISVQKVGNEAKVSNVEFVP
jgi:Mce-associated membrane protein